jgi:hypothetical protein
VFCTAANAVPIAPLSGVSGQPPVEAVRMGSHPLMTVPGAWNEHQRQWDQFQGGQRITTCRNFRSYNYYTRTYRGHDGRRVACPR